MVSQFFNYYYCTHSTTIMHGMTGFYGIYILFSLTNLKSKFGKKNGSSKKVKQILTI